jgi:hypothetical protein
VTRPKHVPQDVVNEALQNLDRTTVILAGVSDYNELEKLPGPSYDLDMAAEIFFEKQDLALFDKKRIWELHNPTNRDFRNAIAKYTNARSATGDILVLYFSGHGHTMPNGSFGFCLKDTRVGGFDQTVLPVTVVSVDSVLATLAIANVHPVLILDACFSGATSPQNGESSALTAEDSLRKHNAQSYALLASSSSSAMSIDTSDGGAFTQALYTVVCRGLSDKVGKRSPLIMMDQLAAPLQEELSKMGVPLSRCFVGPDLPALPIARNLAYKPQTESFTPQMKRIVDLLWNEGAPIEVTRADLNSKIGPGAYGNHSKLSYEPWRLLEDGKSGSKKTRRLSSRGKMFAQGKVEIPREIEQDPFQGEWKAAIGTTSVSIDDV